MFQSIAVTNRFLFTGNDVWVMVLVDDAISLFICNFIIRIRIRCKVHSVMVLAPEKLLPSPKEAVYS